MVQTDEDLHNEANAQAAKLYDLLRPAAHSLHATGLAMLMLVGVLVDDILEAVAPPGGLEEVLRSVRASALEARRNRVAEENSN